MTTAEILQGITGLSVLIAGDICLDRWCTYDPKHCEPSRETGIPRIGVVRTEVTPGGGGTVANNVAVLGATYVAVLGAVGNDGNGYELARALKQRGINAEHLIRVAEIQTFTYTKLIDRLTGVEDQPRVDFIHESPLTSQIERELLERLGKIASDFHVIVALDQSETEGAGVVTAAMRNLLSKIAREDSKKIIWADSRIRSEMFRDVTVKVNRQEADAACQRTGVNWDGLRSNMRAPRLVVTDGAAGVHVVTANRTQAIPARTVDRPVDICGAGDSFSAGAACALALGASDAEAAHFGNLVASVTIMKPGTGTASPAELLDAQG